MKLDDNITNFVIDNFDSRNVLQSVYPNFITILGMICNYIIFGLISCIKTVKINAYVFFAVMLTRFLCDCLDGAVARKYKKTSKLGHILDTVSDMLMMLIIFYAVITVYDLHWIFYSGYGLVLFVLHYNFSIFTSHKTMKNPNGEILSNIISFLTNNSIFTFVSLYIFVIFNNYTSK